MLAILGCCWVPCLAQVSAPSSPPRRATTPNRSGPVIVENRPSAPQVVTILHRLTGLKMVRLLLHSGDVGAIARLDDDFKLSGDVHTNVIAGLALDDGHTIAAWLPEAEVETGSFGFTAKTPSSALPLPNLPLMPSPSAATGTAKAMENALRTALEPPDVTVIEGNGRRLVARYVGLDGVTGLSVLKVAGSSFTNTIDAKEKTVDVGQRVRLFGPEPAGDSEAATSTSIYVKLGEVDARVVTLTRAPSGTLARVRVKSAKLSASRVGGIVINEAGETVGIVDSVEGSEATVLPTGLIRSAAKRVLERQSSVPRPWVGIRGEALGTMPLTQMLKDGWQGERAMALYGEHRGILLTSVTPGSPAALAALRPGDVILRVNEGEIKNAEDFSWFLQEAGAGASVRFTVARPDNLAPQAVEIKLAEPPDPFFHFRMVEDQTVGTRRPGLLNTLGVEAVTLRPGVASRFGADRGLLVLFVQPGTVAFNAGIRPGDLIEAINGQEVSSTSAAKQALTEVGKNYTFNIIRNKQKQVLTFVTSEN